MLGVFFRWEARKELSADDQQDKFLEEEGGNGVKFRLALTRRLDIPSSNVDFSISLLSAGIHESNMASVILWKIWLELGPVA